MPALLLIPLIGLSIGFGWAARGGDRSTPGFALALVSLVGSIGALATVGGSA